VGCAGEAVDLNMPLQRGEMGMIDLARGYR